MTLIASRAALDTGLDDPTLVLMLLFGPPGGSAESVDAFVGQNVQKPWWRSMLMRDDAFLNPAERGSWGGAAETFVMLTRTRAVSRRSTATELLNQDGTPSIMKIRSAFANAGKVA